MTTLVLLIGLLPAMVQAAALSTITNTATNYVQSTAGVTWTVTFTTSTALSSGEKILLTFPSGQFDFTGASASDVTANTGAYSFPTANTLLSTLTGAVGGGTSITITISTVTNPATTGSKAVTIETLTSGDVRIDAGFFAVNIVATGGVNIGAVVAAGDPIVTSVTTNASTSDGYYNSGDTIFVEIGFSELIVVTGTPTLTLDADGDGTASAGDYTALYASGSGGGTLTFTYIVQAGDSTADLDYISTSALALAGGTILANDDAAAATLTLAAPGGIGSIGANRAIVIDNAAPTTAAAVTAGTVGSNSWYTTDATVTITPDDSTVSATDGEAGVTSTNHCVDQTNSCAPSGGTTTAGTIAYTATISTEGTNYVRYASTDAAGNLQSTASLTVKVDKTAPTGTISINSAASYANSTTLTLTLAGSDAASSVASMQFSCDNTTYSTAEAYATTKSWDLSAQGAQGCTTTEGTQTVYVRFIDNAGLTSTAMSDSITLDTTAPVLTISDPTGDISVTSGVSSYTVVGTASDTNLTSTTVAGTTVADPTSFSAATTLATGTNVISIIATDAADNTTTITRTITRAAATGGGGGGGSSGGGSASSSVAYSLPNLVSSTPISISRPIGLDQTDGLLTRPVTLYNNNNNKLKVFFEQNTTVQNSDGSNFTGEIKAPKTITVGAITIDGQRFVPLSGVQVITDPSPAILGQPATLTFPLTGTAAQIEAANVYFYNPSTSTYEIVTAERTVNVAQKTISVKVDHFSIYVVFATDAPTATATGTLPTGETGADSGAGTAGLSDVPSTQWFASFVQQLASKNIITGYPDGTFRPAEQMNRAEISKVVIKAFDISAPDVTTNPFPDVPSDQWFAPFVAAMRDADITGGYPDGSFRPGSPVNRAEILKFLLEGAGIDVPQVSTVAFDDVPAEAWFASYVAFAKEEGIVAGNTELVSAIEFANVLSLGSYGDEVTLLQEMLTELDYYAGPVTGYFGPLTQQAIFGFQNSYAATWQADGYGFAGGATTRQIIELVGRDQTITRTVFRPGDSVTRAEAAKMVTLVMALANK